MRKFILENNLKLIIEDEVLNAIYKFNPISYKHENGGVLLGKFNKEENTYVITNISTTNSKDKKGKYFFRFSQKILLTNLLRLVWFFFCFIIP